MPDAISFEDAMKILAQARTGLAGYRPPAPHKDAMPDVYGVQGDQPETQAQANIPNPPGWSDKFRQPDEPTKPTWNNSGVDPGFSAGGPDYGNGFKGRPGYQVEPVNLPKYGPHNPVLSEDQAHLLQLLWLVTGQNANTVGRGRVLQFKPVQQAPPPEPPPAAPTGNAGAFQARAE